jgi:tRNA-2-methylthio-N6-dimethylallyladenosine synthase
VVNFDAGVDGAQLIGKMLDLRITESYAYSLRGELVTL